MTDTSRLEEIKKIESDDESEELSPNTLAALQEFLSERKEREEKIKTVMEQSPDNLEFDEDWQLSQFWYDDETADRLAEEALRVVGDSGTIACVSCPTLYKALKKKKPDGVRTVVFEYDTRFAIYGTDFAFYDYKSPLEVPRELQGQCDLVVADPPFLSEECLTKTAVTVKFLAKKKIVLCTGAIMSDLACRLLHLDRQEFQPRHKNNLANDFSCFANYDFMPKGQP